MCECFGASVGAINYGLVRTDLRPRGEVRLRVSARVRGRMRVKGKTDGESEREWESETKDHSVRWEDRDE